MPGRETRQPRPRVQVSRHAEDDVNLEGGIKEDYMVGRERGIANNRLMPYRVLFGEEAGGPEHREHINGDDRYQYTEPPHLFFGLELIQIVRASEPYVAPESNCQEHLKSPKRVLQIHPVGLELR